MIDNPYAPPAADVQPTIRKLEWWNRCLMVLVFLFCCLNVLATTFIYWMQIRLVSRPEVSFKADVGDWALIVFTVVATLAVLCAGVLLLLRRRWAPYFFLPAIALSLFDFTNGFKTLHMIGFVILVTCAGYAALLAKQDYLH